MNTKTAITAAKMTIPAITAPGLVNINIACYSISVIQGSSGVERHVPLRPALSKALSKAIAAF
jgi:hypothetical protein